MTVVCAPDATSAVQGRSATILSRILDPSVSLAIWRRTLTTPLREASDHCRGCDVQLRSVVNHIDQLDVDEFGDALGVDRAATLRPVTDDLFLLSTLFSGVIGSSSVQIRLETIADDGCRLFHFDNVALRLVVTYRGPGTQWVHPANAVSARALQNEYQGPLCNIETGDVALFRGRRSAVAGMTLHRSPRLPRGAPPRLLGVIDCQGA